MGCLEIKNQPGKEKEYANWVYSAYGEFDDVCSGGGLRCRLRFNAGT
jgi:hypothetical protein